MSSSVGLNPVIQKANGIVAQATPNMGTRLRSSQNVVTACENFDLNGPFFETNRTAIQDLIARTAKLSEALETLSKAGIDTGSCVVGKKFFGLSKVTRPIVEVQSEIQSNLNQEVVQTGLRTLGILPAQKKPLLTMPACPSSKTLVKAGVAAGTVATVAGLGYAYRETIPSLSEIQKNMPSMPSFQEVRTAVVDAFESVKDRVNSLQMPSMPSFQEVREAAVSAFDTVSKFGSDNKTVLIGVGAAVGVAAVGAGIYKVVQNRQAKAAEANNAPAAV